MLTGGTDDVNPQYLNFTFPAVSSGTVVEVPLGTPIVRVGEAGKDTAIIMEILKIYFEGINEADAAATQDERSIAFSVTTLSSGATPVLVPLGNPRCIAAMKRFTNTAFTAAGTGMTENATSPMVWDCTDGAGHGILVATDNIFLQCAVEAAGSVTPGGKILYRFKKVKLVEYIGIVQSQQ